MIKIYAEKDKVQIQFEGMWPIAKWYFTASFNTASEPYAALLADNVQTAMQERLKEIKRRAYNRGREDMRRRRKKQTFFCSNWDADE